MVRGAETGVRINAEWVERFRYFDRLVARVADVEGAIVECGVAGGQSFAMLASLLRDRGQERRLWGFDTFAGLPAPGVEDLGSEASVARAGMFGWAREGAVIAELRSHGFDDQWIERQVRLVKGLFDETLAGYSGGPIALLHVDADLYESYRTALGTLWPVVTQGGIVALDEYEDEETWPGAKRAVDEFLRGVPRGSADLVHDDEIGKWYLIKR